MTGDGLRPVPVWAGSRGLHVMIRMALSQQGRTAITAATLAEFRKAIDDTRSRVVIVAAEDLAASGLDAVLLEKIVGDGTAVVLLSAARPLPDPSGPRTRVLPIPFTARDLLDAVSVAPEPSWSNRSGNQDRQAPEQAAPPPPPVASPQNTYASEAIADTIRHEIDRLVTETARQVIEEVARRIVPELAEAMIREELARLLRASDETALAGPGSQDDDRQETGRAG